MRGLLVRVGADQRGSKISWHVSGLSPLNPRAPINHCVGDGANL